jgi:hypothetical protein
MSELNINFHNSEVIGLEQPIEVQHRVANKLNCQLGWFQFMYLGLPEPDKKIDLWQRRFLSSGEE